MYRLKYSLVFLVLCVTINSQKLEQQRIQSYEPCQTDRDCKENSFCYGNDDEIKGKCKCLKGFELNRNSTFYECIRGMTTYTYTLFLGTSRHKEIRSRKTDNSRLSNIKLFVFGISHIYNMLANFQNAPSILILFSQE
jgi:hypothetical protein